MKRLIRFVIVGGALLLPAAVANAQQARSVSIAELMSARERETTGIQSLTADQLDALSNWLADYQRALIQEAVDETGEGAQVEDRIIETRIDGDFDGWVGDTIFRLENGQIWQQTSVSAKYLFTHAPRVVISRAPYRMKVEGIAAEISVRRLR